MAEYSDAVKKLMACTDEMVPAKAIAPILGAKPDALIAKAKMGKWDRDVCNYFISGRRVKFYRIDFLKKGGWIS